MTTKWRISHHKLSTALIHCEPPGVTKSSFSAEFMPSNAYSTTADVDGTRHTHVNAIFEATVQPVSTHSDELCKSNEYEGKMDRGVGAETRHVFGVLADVYWRREHMGCDVPVG